MGIEVVEEGVEAIIVIIEIIEIIETIGRKNNISQEKIKINKRDNNKMIEIIVDKTYI